MKPHRIRMTHNLLLNYGLYKKMQIYVSFSFETLLILSFVRALCDLFQITPKIIFNLFLLWKYV